MDCRDGSAVRRANPSDVAAQIVRAPGLGPLGGGSRDGTPCSLDVFRHRAPINPATLHFLVFPPENSSINAEADAAVSPDGSHLAFVAADLTAKEILWIRPLDSLSARPLAGTEGAAYPFWSPDGH